MSLHDPRYERERRWWTRHRKTSRTIIGAGLLGRGWAGTPIICSKISSWPCRYSIMMMQIESNIECLFTVVQVFYSRNAVCILTILSVDTRSCGSSGGGTIHLSGTFNATLPMYSRRSVHRMRGTTAISLSMDVRVCVRVCACRRGNTHAQSRPFRNLCPSHTLP